MSLGVKRERAWYAVKEERLERKVFNNQCTNLVWKGGMIFTKFIRTRISNLTLVATSTKWKNDFNSFDKTWWDIQDAWKNIFFTFDKGYLF